MKAQELRINNIGIYTVSGKQFMARVIQIGLIDVLIEYDSDSVKSITAKATPGYNFSAIPLTEDWLLKFGFEKNEYSVDGVQYSEPFFHVNLESKGWLVRWIDTLSTWALHPKVSDYNVVPCRYVHQLQNLYYSLTGTELTIKEE